MQLPCMIQRFVVILNVLSPLYLKNFAYILFYSRQCTVMSIKWAKNIRVLSIDHFLNSSTKQKCALNLFVEVE